jgi:2-polyprenyl-3-methyl-5-hydroxy-6-metoxy-1,4-benzoquinol methylase
MLRDASLRQPSVLELGCGTGALSVALLEMGAARVTGIDLSPESVAVARRRAAEAGFDDRATFSVGDAVEADAEPHDWVVMDRVVCCFGDGHRLVERAIRLARERIVMTAPESRGWRGLANRPLWAGENLMDLFTGGCRGYVHDLRRFERTLAAAGFLAARRRHQRLWFIGSYERA